MYYKEKWVREIEAVTDALLERIRIGDIEGARVLKDRMEGLLRKEIRWIIEEVERGNIRKRK